MENQNLSTVSWSLLLPQPDRENENSFVQRPNAPRTFPEIDLANTHIGETVRRTFPQDMPRRLRVVPFDFDPNEQILKVACADPFDPRLVEELTAGLYNVAVEFYAANPEAIDRVIAELTDTAPKPDSQGEQPPAPTDPGFDDSTFWSFIEDRTPAAEPLDEPPAEPIPIEPAARRSVLFVTPHGCISEHLRSSFRAEQVAVTVVKDTPAAQEFLRSESVEAVFVDDSLRLSDEATRWFRLLAPGTAVHYYRSEVALLMNETVDDFAQDLIHRNLATVGHLYGTLEKPLYAHARMVTRLADALSRRFDLPANLCLALATAASFHNLAEAHLTSIDLYAQAEIIGLSAGRLAAWGYPPLVVGLLRQMYYDRAGTAQSASNPEALAGQILTAADIYCHAWPEPQALTQEQLCRIKRSLPQQMADLVDPEVTRILVEVVGAMVPKRSCANQSFAAHIFVSRGSLPDDLEPSLADAGIDVTWSYSADECARFCARSRPDVLLIRDGGNGPDICDLILGLSLRGVAVDHLPTILLVEAEAVDDATRLIKHGIEDVFNAAMNVGVLVTKMVRLRKRSEEKAQSRIEVLRELGTHGSLEDMSLIDLLETTRNSPRPMQLSLSAAGRQLALWVDKGNIIYAECDEAKGIDAILQGIGWKQGIWNIDAVDQSQLPEPNVNQKIDAVLLEACTKYDSHAAR